MKKVVLFLAEGFEEMEALGTADILRRGDIECDLCSIKDTMVNGAHGISVKADLVLDGLQSDKYDGVILPGGMPGAKNLKECKRVIEIIQKFHSQGKIVAAICAAPIVLKEAEILSGKKVTSYPGFQEMLGDCIYCEEIVVEDQNIITSRGPATMAYFALSIVKRLVGKDVAETIQKGLLIDFVEAKASERHK